MFRRFISKLKRQYGINQSVAFSVNALLKIAELRHLHSDLSARQPNNLALKGYKVYSQNDEDGILAAIFEKIGGNRTFLEIGLQDGTECNTLYLLQQGWRGGWIEADAGFCQAIRAALEAHTVPGVFKLVEEFVRSDNIETLYRDICKSVGKKDLALFSLDIDGNDLHVIDALLKSGARPDVICAEYNGKFPVPIVASVKKDDSRGWAGDDYFGVSLEALAQSLDSYGYGLITCNLFGVNAFFAKKEHADNIQFYSPADVWQPLRLYLTPYPVGHIPSLKFARDALANHRADEVARR